MRLTKRTRRSNGQFSGAPSTASRLFVMSALTFTVTVSATLQAYAPKEMLVPYISSATLVTPAEAKTVKQETVTLTPQPVAHKSIEELITEAFPENPQVAYAVMMAEGGNNPKAANKSKAATYVKNGKKKFYPGECSIGLYQINLRADGCTGKKVHWDKVPGETLEEKIAWLEIPENNIKIAKQIKNASKSWRPWGGYTSNSYLKYMR